LAREVSRIQEVFKLIPSIDEVLENLNFIDGQTMEIWWVKMGTSHICGKA
jgi:hypothetical protein